MGNSVSGIRETFYRDLASGYRREGEKSFLYRYFWQENARELLGKLFPGSTVEEPITPKAVRSKLCAAMRENPEWASGLLLRDPPGDGRKERRDFWQELTLNDAGYRAGLIPDTEYYAWLTSYLAARDIYYKDSGPWDTDGAMWLRPLLRAGLGNAGRGDASKAQTERDLKALARLLREEGAAGRVETAGRLHGLRQRVVRDGQPRQVDYLPWLTTRLKRAALHSKIRTWLQDGGYPLRTEGGPAAAQKGPRKQDFSLRLLDAYCGSPAGYDFTPRSLSGWRMSGEGFCVLGADQLEPLLNALRQQAGQSDIAYLYLPLAVHVESGCVFFLAGKSIYEDAYAEGTGAAQAAYDRGGALYCFDYLRMNEAFWASDHGAANGPFRLEPTFHENAGKSYAAVLNDFKRYCVAEAKSAIAELRGLNDSAPAGTPDAFLWAFYAPEKAEPPAPSREGRDAFERARSTAPQGHGALMV